MGGRLGGGVELRALADTPEARGGAGDVDGADRGAAPLGYPDYAAVAPDANPLGEAIDDARDRLAAVRALAARQRAGLDGLARTASARGGPIRASEQRARRSPSARLCRERTAAWQQLSDILKLSSPEHVVPSAAGADDAGAALNGRHRRLPWRARAGGQTTSQASPIVGRALCDASGRVGESCRDGSKGRPRASQGAVGSRPLSVGNTTAPQRRSLAPAWFRHLWRGARRACATWAECSPCEWQRPLARDPARSS